MTFVHLFDKIFYFLTYIFTKIFKIRFYFRLSAHKTDKISCAIKSKMPADSLFNIYCLPALIAISIAATNFYFPAYRRLSFLISSFFAI